MQVAPGNQEGHSERNVCVVVDAQTGKVLATWAGTAARPGSRRPAASTAQSSSSVLFQLTNFKRQPGENGYPYGNLALMVSTFSNPYSYRSDSTQPVTGVCDQNLAMIAPWFEDVTRFFCVVRKYCGRDSGTAGVGGGDYNRWFLGGNHGSEDSAYLSNEHILIGSNDSDDPDVVAHEVGHAIEGHILQYIPMALPARREFGDVRVAFENTARGLFPNGGEYEGSVEQKVDAAFNEVGVKASSNRNIPC